MADESGNSREGRPSAAIQKAHEQYLASRGKPPMTAHDEIAEQDRQNAQDPRFSHYDYYMIGNDLPVRFWVDKQGGRYAAQWPGDGKGTLAFHNSLMDKIDKDDIDFTKIDGSAFSRLLANYVKPPSVTISPETEKLYQDHVAREKAKGKTHGGRE